MILPEVAVQLCGSIPIAILLEDQFSWRFRWSISTTDLPITLTSETNFVTSSRPTETEADEEISLLQKSKSIAQTTVQVCLRLYLYFRRHRT